MENAAKALMMAGGILIGVLILALMVTLFVGSRNLSKTYDETKKQEAIQQFNSNFTKYLGQELTIHQVMTITNFAKIENNKIRNVKVVSNISTNTVVSYTIEDIKNDVIKHGKEWNNIKRSWNRIMNQENKTTNRRY